MLFLLIACGDKNNTQYSGHTTYGYMPLDETRSWRYQNEGMTFEMGVTKGESYMKENTEVFPLIYSNHDTSQNLATIDWSSDDRDGILIHAYTLTNQGGMEFEEPIIFAEYKMVPGEIVETETEGITFSSTFVGVETCPNNWIDEENTWDCLHFTISSDSSASNFPFTGDWWLAQSWGASRFVTPDGTFGSSNTWLLSQATYSAE